jgi:glycosyltransferase involved in cell wall biosynthesis
MTGVGELVFVSAMSAQEAPGGRVLLTKKFLTGMDEYVRRWPGPVRLVIGRAEGAWKNLDEVALDPADLPFRFQWLPSGEDLYALLAGGGLVSAGLFERDLALAPMCRRAGTPLVYTSENSLRTRRQMVRAETRNPLLRLRRELWHTRAESRYVEAVRQSRGLQCNGTPTYEAYKELGVPALLFFDSRVREDMIVSPATLARRTAQMTGADSPLRLCFTGRLVAIKGADHLVQVAEELRRLGVRFTLDICGGGDLEDAIRRDVARLGLGEIVRLRGVLDFESELMPLVAANADLFVCCHRQGDPSCTYLETLACGVPVVGYDNEALVGISRVAGVGWTTSLDKPARLAEEIARLNRDRAALAVASSKAREFALRHTFEKTMDARVDHLLACRGAAPAREARVGAAGA